jgi:hypothetical protein
MNENNFKPFNDEGGENPENNFFQDPSPNGNMQGQLPAPS